MYGKYHASAFTGSMRGSGAVVFAVWGYIIANTNQHSVIELNPDIVAFLLGCDPAEVESAIEKLCAEDSKSRSKDFDGRRLVKEGEYQYFVPTHKKYREIKTSEEKREYNRVKQQESRLKRGPVKQRVKNVNAVNTTEEEEEEDTEEKESIPPKPPKSKLPTSEPAIRISNLYRRRLTTPWSDKEIKAFKAIGEIDLEDLSAVEKYYASERSKPDGRHRRDIFTLLNNFQSEVDRARNASPPQQPKFESPL